MRYKIECEENNVAQHFGNCDGFEIFTVEGEEITSRKFIKNPGHVPGFLPNYLNDQGVNVVIAGGMGGGAIEIFNEKRIKVIVGASGEPEDNVNRLLKGELKSTNSVCDQHMHNGSCGGH